ncbi:hypothetical protein ACFT8P_10575 [Streptomyces sp. NPDC057101]|uniref:hypothetical protein n=1 Tax=Streptomyces sp. NPDC057101 TaxID=3346020 RepID=UPI003641B8F5
MATTPTAPPASEAPAPEPDSTPTEPEPTPTDPAPEPTPTGPTPNPTEPTAGPTPSTEPTADACPALPLATLGDPGDAVGRVTLGPRGSACFTVTVEKPGLHRLLLRGGYLSLTLSSGGTPVACPALDITPCALDAGTYRLDVVRPDAYSGEVQIAVVPLTAGPGCQGPVSTDIGAAPAAGSATSDLGIFCHSFTATPGALIKAYVRPASGTFANIHAWITDGTGKRLCNVEYDCVLPPGTAGTGDYRVLAHFSPSPVPYTVEVRRLSDPAGCAVVSVTAYGSAPTEVSPPASCKTFTPVSTGAYAVRRLGTSGDGNAVEMYAPTGRTCAASDVCSLTAGVTYTLVTDETVRILDQSSSEGCENVTLGQLHRGGLAASGEVDCVRLPVPQDARVAVQAAPAADGVIPDVTVVDATGTTLCWDKETLSSGGCALAGTAPYRAIVKWGYPGPVTGSYGLVVRRTDKASDCRVLPAGDFGKDSARATVLTGDGAFGDCLTIPANDHSTRELVRLTDAAGNATGDFTVLDETGEQVCGYSRWGDFQDDCSLTPGLSYTVLVPGDGRPTGHVLVRRDVTGTARGCVETPATMVGAPALAGPPTEPQSLVCHRVTTADARDTLHLHARYTATGRAYGLRAHAANGEPACGNFDEGCAVSGSTAYQAIVEVGHGDPTAPSYRFDAFRIGTAAGPAPECVRVPDVTYGFGPLIDTLSEQKPALCAVLPTASDDWIKLAFAPALAHSKSPTPWLYDHATRRDLCYRTSSGYYSCEVPNVDDRYEYIPRPTTLVIGLPSIPSQTPTEVRATAYCQYLCGTVTRAIRAITPGTVGAGKITMRVTGAALHEKDVVEVYGGGFRARSTTVSVAPDRRNMDISLDLTNAPRTALNLSVVTHDGNTYQHGRVTVIAPLRNTAAPTVVGTPVIGAKVTAGNGAWSPAADSFVYQWKANGVSIPGATASSYVVPSTLLGKQLTVAVGARKAGHPAVLATSAGVTVKNLAPKPTRNPYITGSARVGGKVTAVVGTWSPAPTSYTYQWRVNGLAIPGATGASYVLPPAALGKKLTVTVAAHRTGHLSGAYTTAGYTVALGLAPKATTAPYVTGTVRVGRVLTLNRGAWTPAPTSYTYQWYANGRAITGATRATHTLTTAQRGTRITVKVTAHRTGHTAGTAWTRSTAAVTG